MESERLPRYGDKVAEPVYRTPALRKRTTQTSRQPIEEQRHSENIPKQDDKSDIPQPE